MTTILLVEDSPVTKRMLGLILEKQGYNVMGAENGLEALELLDQEEVNLILCDLAMPEMDGLTLLKHLRIDSRYSNIPVIMLTASGQDQDCLTAKAEGVADFLTKPSSSRELIETVNRVLGAIPARL